MDELAGELHNIDLDLAGSQATVDECKKPAGHLGLKCSAVFGFELRGDGAVEVKNTRRIVHIAGRGELGDSLAQSAPASRAEGIAQCSELVVTRVSCLEFVEERFSLGPLLLTEGRLDLEDRVRTLEDCRGLKAGGFAAAVDPLGDTLEQSDGPVEEGLELLELLNVMLESLLQQAGPESQQRAAQAHAANANASTSQTARSA